METEKILNFLNFKMFKTMGIPNITESNITEKDEDLSYIDLTFSTITNAKILNAWNIKDIRIYVCIDKTSELITTSVCAFGEDISITEKFKFSDVDDYLKNKSEYEKFFEPLFR